MIMPIDIDKKEFTRDKKGYNSREVDEFLDLIIVDYERVLNDNRNMAHKIKFLEKQLEESQKSDSAMLETLETAKRLMADISASAERRAELMMRDAELESDNMILEAKTTVRNLNEEHITLKQKVERLKSKYKQMLSDELEKIDDDEYNMLPDLDRSDIPDIDSVLGGVQQSEKVSPDTIIIKDNKKKNTSAERKTNPNMASTRVLSKNEVDSVKKGQATVEDLSDSLKSMSKEQSTVADTIILQ